MPRTTKTDPAVLYKQIMSRSSEGTGDYGIAASTSTSKRASQKMWENNAAMPDDASANDNVSSARPDARSIRPTPFDEVIDISDLVAERRRLQRNLWAMRIITIVLLIAAIAVACFPLALQFESDRNLAATTATTAKK